MKIRYKFGSERTWNTWEFGDEPINEIVEGKVTIECDDASILIGITHLLNQAKNIQVVENKFPGRFLITHIRGTRYLIDLERNDEWPIAGPIEAIAQIRRCTGLGLAEAKKIWDDLKPTTIQSIT